MRYEIPSVVQIRDLTHGQLNLGGILENLILKNKVKKLHFVTVHPFILKLGVHAIIRDTYYLVLQ